MRQFLVVAAGLLALTGCASATQAGSGPATTSAGPTSPSAAPSSSDGTTTGPPIGGPATIPAVPLSTLSAEAIANLCTSDLISGITDGVTGQKVPSDISVTSVVRCTTMIKGTTRTIVTEKSTSDPSALVAALQMSSEPKAKTVCPMYRAPGPAFGLVQPNAQILVPTLPTNSCGQTQQAVLTALNALKFSVIATKVEK